MRGESGVLATVVRVEGSTYRRAGARLLMTSRGRRVGSVSGGCLEADLVKKAWWLTENGRAAIRKYDTTVEGDIAQEFGMGCNGVIHVLLERLGSGLISPLFAVPVVKQHRQPGHLATVIESNNEANGTVGQRWASLPDGTIETDLASRSLETFARHATLSVGAKPQVVCYDDHDAHIDFFVEPIVPTLRLLVFGAGDDAVPLARLAAFMGYEVTVLDGRSHMARTERFTSADRVLVTSAADPLAGVKPDEWTAAILMSHSYAQDLAALKALAAFRLPYLGMLGPRKRTERMLSEADIALDQVADFLHSPIGLDIGADGAEQIALAVIAEIQSVLNRRGGGRLREKAGPLHLDEIHYELPLACPLS